MATSVVDVTVNGAVPVATVDTSEVARKEPVPATRRPLALELTVVIRLWVAPVTVAAVPETLPVTLPVTLPLTLPVTLPSKLATKVPVAIIRFPIDAALPVVVPTINFSADSSQPINALSPEVPRSIIIPESFVLSDVKPLFNPIILSLMSKLVTVVVIPVTFKFPAILTLLVKSAPDNLALSFTRVLK